MTDAALLASLLTELRLPSIVRNWRASPTLPTATAGQPKKPSLR